MTCPHCRSRIPRGARICRICNRRTRSHLPWRRLRRKPPLTDELLAHASDGTKRAVTHVRQAHTATAGWWAQPGNRRKTGEGFVWAAGAIGGLIFAWFLICAIGFAMLLLFFSAVWS